MSTDDTASDEHKPGQGFSGKFMHSKHLDPKKLEVKKEAGALKTMAERFDKMRARENGVAEPGQDKARRTLGFAAGLKPKEQLSFSEEELMNSPDLPTLLNRLNGLPDDAGPKFGLLAGQVPVDKEGKPRFFTAAECLERSLKRHGGIPQPMTMEEATRQQFMINKWQKLQQQQNNEQGTSR